MVHNGNRISKRKTLRQKYALQKAKKSHKEKIQKLLRKNPHLHPKISKKDPGIPNLFPFKDALLEAAERRMERVAEEQEVQKERRRQLVKKKRAEQAAALLKSAEAEPVTEKPSERPERELMHNRQDVSRRGWYLKELRRCVEESDVILEVLDARDPIGCRCLAVEKLITGRMSSSSARPKRLILLLNKVDLVPPEVAAQWVDYLRAEFPCVAFKASTQRQADRLSQQVTPSLAAVSAASAGSTAAGAGKLLQLLKDYSIHGGVRAHLTVGVIGYPNTGKSSVINTLKRARAVGVGAMPGFTKEVSAIKLDRNITLLDSPGVLFSADETKDPGLVLRNCLRVEDIEDPVGAVRVMLSRCSAVDLMKLYGVPEFASADEFLYHVASQRGKLRKGGVPDLEAAARLVLQDWNQGSIRYYTTPPKSRRPKREEVAAQEAETAQIVNSWAPEFDIDRIIDEHNKATLRSIGSGMGGGRFVQVQSSEPSTFSFEDAERELPGDARMGADGDEEDEEDEEGDEDEDGDDEGEDDESMGDEDVRTAPSERRSTVRSTVSSAERRHAYEILLKGKGLAASTKEARAAAAAAAEHGPKESVEDEFNKQTNRNIKKEQQKLKKKQGKEQRRQMRASTTEGGEDESMGAASRAAEVDFDAPYDFNEWEE